MIPTVALLTTLVCAPTSTPPDLAVGLLVGEPNGLTLAAPVLETFRVHAAAGLSADPDRDALATFDFTYDMSEIIGRVFGTGWMSVWFGLGVRYAASDVDASEDAFGMRVPFGVSYFDDATGVEVFGSVAYGVVFIPERDASGEVAFGLRFGL
ncbi:MAG: hypothetical protein RIT81_39855 [Deltaproteobacteria bacterium]